MTSQIFLVLILVLASFGLGQWSAVEGYTLQWAWEETQEHLPKDKWDRLVKDAGMPSLGGWLKKREESKPPKAVAAKAEKVEKSEKAEKKQPVKFVDGRNENVDIEVLNGQVVRVVPRTLAVAKTQPVPLVDPKPAKDKDDEGLSPTDKQALFHLLK